jgi:hypothetical protein
MRAKPERLGAARDCSDTEFAKQPRRRIVTADSGTGYAMNFDLKKLSTAELEAHIAAAIRERAYRPEHDLSQPAHSEIASGNLGWAANIMDGTKLLLTFRHSGAGVISFLFGKSTFAQLYGYFAQVAAMNCLTDEMPPGVNTAPTNNKLN